MCFPLGASGQTLVLHRQVLARFARYRQRRWWEAEAGGQLFAKFAGDTIDVVEATGPRRTDRRSRWRYEPDKLAEQQEIDARHPRGLHFVGDWHSHAERLPTPSGQDLVSISETARRSHHHLNGLLLVIVGIAAPPEGLHLSVHDGQDSIRLHPAIALGKPVGLAATPIRWV